LGSQTSVKTYHQGFTTRHKDSHASVTYNKSNKNIRLSLYYILITLRLTLGYSKTKHDASTSILVSQNRVLDKTKEMKANRP